MTRQMVLYWGGRSQGRPLHGSICRKWQREHDNFSFMPVISDALPEDNWTGRTGFVHRAVMEDFPDLSGYQVYACGAPVMVESAHADFTSQCNLPEDEFFSDAFTPSDGQARLATRRGASIGPKCSRPNLLAVRVSGLNPTRCCADRQRCR